MLKVGVRYPAVRLKRIPKPLYRRQVPRGNSSTRNSVPQRLYDDSENAWNIEEKTCEIAA